MNDIFVRPAKPEDAETFIQWAVTNKGNEFDPAAVAYPDSFTLCAFDVNGPLVFMPIQQPMFAEPMLLESLAVRPEASVKEIAVALKELVQACVTIGFMKGTGEIYFLGSNEATNRFAEHHKVFERLDWPVYRLRMTDLLSKENINDNP
jgi:hypothetical protein